MNRTAARFLVAAICLTWLTGCETSSNFGDLFKPQGEPQTTGTVPAPGPEYPSLTPEKLAAPGLVGSDPYDNLNLGKRHFRAENYGLAEQFFRRAVEASPRDIEAWLGLAAAYDRLNRFDLADRAYAQVIAMAGPTPAILNNQGFSYILRGEYKRAREILLSARAKDPANPFIKANLDLLEESARKRKAVQ
jgi:tetratricopeptide (TPR) repeat protein